MRKVSIIVPLYNKQDDLIGCLESLIRQTYHDIEVIIIDDASEDRSWEIANEYSKKFDFIKLKTHTKNLGVSEARNTGLNESTGSYVYFLDANDYIAEYTIELLINNVEDSEFITGIVNRKKISFDNLYHNEDYKINMIHSNTRKFAERSRTVANVLFKKSFLLDNNLYFNKNTRYYSDLSVMIPVLNEVDSFIEISKPMYQRGINSDPIENPSLSETNDIIKYEDLLNIYMELSETISNDKIKIYLDERILKLYFIQITNAVLRKEVTIERLFSKLSNCFSRIEPSQIEKNGKIGKREIYAFINSNQKKAEKWLLARTMVKRIKNASKSKINLYKEINKVIFLKLPLKKNRVIFESFGGKAYSCNPKYIYEELYKKEQNYELIWIFNNPKNSEVKGPAKKVKRLSLKYFYYMATSKYWVINARLPNFIIKRDGISYIQTWHGTPLKKLGFDIKEVKMPGTTNLKYKRNFYNESRNWDYLISANSYSSDIFERAFKFNKKLLEFGYPRNDILYLNNEKSEAKRMEIVNKIGLPTDKKVILYAPTWRDDEYYNKGEYKFSLKLDLEKMKSKFKDEYVIILRMHYLISGNIDLSGLDDFVYDLSDYSDIAEIYLISDMLITDYSSVFFDYANLEKPIIFYTYDIEKYRDDLRGFYIDFENEAPGPLVKNTEEVIDVIENIEDVNEAYKDKYSKFTDNFCSYDDGTAAKKVVKEIFKA